MHYQVSRAGQIYGPYTIDDLRRYVASGNVLLTDLVKSEEMADWTTVQDLFSRHAAEAAPATGFPPDPGVAAGVQAAAAAPAYGSVQPDYLQPPYAQANPAQTPAAGYGFAGAPDLNWGLVLLFDILTCSLFQAIWNLIVAAWLRRVQPNATSLFYYIGALVLGVLQGSFIVPVALHQAAGIHMMFHPVTSLLGLVTWVVRLIARFSQKASLEEHYNGPEPIGLRLSGVMVFFFGGIYFQYHLNRINAIKNAARIGLPRPY